VPQAVEAHAVFCGLVQIAALAGDRRIEALAVPKTADAAAIRAAFRRLARIYHPDHNPGDRAAEERFKLLATAYDVLSDPEKRSLYDRTGSTKKVVIPSRRGKYQIDELIAHGDLADVYRATHLETGETVALMGLSVGTVVLALPHLPFAPPRKPKS
jgi:ABC-type uncharacterized transport system permease subunit